MKVSEALKDKKKKTNNNILIIKKYKSNSKFVYLFIHLLIYLFYYQSMHILCLDFNILFYAFIII